MKKELLGAVIFSLLAGAAHAQSQPKASPVPDAHWTADSQARTAKPGTVTSPNPDNAAIAKIEAAGKHPNPGPRQAPLSEPAGPGSGENNSGGR